MQVAHHFNPTLDMETATAFTPSTTPDIISANLQHIGHAHFLIKSVYNKNRQDILCKLLQGNSFSVYELCNLMGMEQSMMSQHLGVLRKANLVKTRRDGKYIYYSTNVDTLSEMLHYIKNLWPAEQLQ